MSLDEVRQRYIRGIIPRLHSLEQACDKLREGGAEVEESEVRSQAHQLRGSGSTYGFPEISAAAATVEEARPDELVAALEALIEELHRTVRIAPDLEHSILVVEDDPDLARWLAKKLGAPGREVLVVGSARAASEVLLRQGVSLILLDLFLPDADGRNFLMRLRESPTTASVPIVLMSVQVGNRIRKECLTLGADDFLEKPFDGDELQACVEARLAPVVSSDVAFDPKTPAEVVDATEFRMAFARARVRMARTGDPFTVALLGDVGPSHVEGLAESVVSMLRDSDVVAAWDGELAAVLLMHTAVDKAQDAWERMAARSARALAVGLVRGDPERNLDAVLQEARRLMYLVRAQGQPGIMAHPQEAERAPGTVLLVEDDELVAFLVRDGFRREGYEIQHFADGLAAWEAHDGLEPDLVILDVQLPGLNGFELLERLRASSSYARVPILMLTSLGKPEDLRRGFQLGADDYIVKPFSLAEVLSRAERLLSAGRE